MNPSNPANESLQWIAQALNDYRNTLPPSVAAAFTARAQAAVAQVNIAINPPEAEVAKEPVPSKEQRNQPAPPMD